MKALVVGPCLADFDPGYNQSIDRALRARGYDVQIANFWVPSPPGIANRLRIDLALALGYRKYYESYVHRFNSELLARFRAFKPDLVLAIRGSKILPETLDAMAGAVRVLWLQDIARRCELTPDQLKRYELRFVFEASDVRWLQDTYGLESEFLPVGFDPAVYHPDGNTSRDIDVFFIGAYYPERRATLERLAHDFRHLHLRFYGRHVRYREPKTWVSAVSYSVSYPGTFVNRCLNASEINHFYKRSKICLNMHHEQSQSGCNPRVFEIMGAGAFQLVDAIPYLRDNLGGVVTTYSCYDELRTTIEYYLREAKLREELATNGFKFVLEKHTFQHRVDRILEEVCRQ